LRWVVDSSGVSRFLFYVGLVITNEIAMKLYRSNLINDLFLL
jgi:hypothetical protein